MSTSRNFSLKKIAVAAYGPSFLFGMVEGAIYPIIALTARGLGASIAQAGLIVALIGVGALVNNIPASLLTARFGERRAMVSAAALAILALMLCISASTPLVLAIGIFMIGMAQAVFTLARQTYLAEAVPAAMRARALSTLGGVIRIGLFISPFLSAAVMQVMGLQGAYWLASVAAAAAGALAFTLPDLEPHDRQAKQTAARNAAASRDAPSAKSRKIGALLREHRRSFATLGTACMLVGAMRTSRQIVIPLWAAHIMLDAATVSVVYGTMSAIEMLLFYPAGRIMDRYGRQWVALPCMVIMSSALFLMPFTNQLWSFLIVIMLLGMGNGIGSGLVMTVGVDCSPAYARPQFLGLWRFITDIGNCGGPLLVSGIAATTGLASGIFAVGTLGFAAAALFWKWLPRP